MLVDIAVLRGARLAVNAVVHMISRLPPEAIRRLAVLRRRGGEPGEAPGAVPRAVLDVLVDPMCGSGTIPIEAICAARTTPRPTPALAALGLARPSPPLFPDAAPLVIGCDLDLAVLAAARDNARAAGVADEVVWQRTDIARLTPGTVDDIARERGRAPGTGVLLTNPPYGERLDDADLGELCPRR